MKYLLVLVVVVVVLWSLLRDRKPAPARRKAAKAAPDEMVACAHCALHLPRGEALLDPAGRPFCNDAHRIAGPR
jgi:uncharacterized protein